MSTSLFFPAPLALIHFAFRSSVCDRQFDCADGSDERNCSHNDIMIPDKPYDETIENLRFDIEQYTLEWDPAKSTNRSSLVYNVYLAENSNNYKGESHIN